MKTARWKAGLEDPDVRRWFENLRRGSEVTADETARVLCRYLNHLSRASQNLTPWSARSPRRARFGRAAAARAWVPG